MSNNPTWQCPQCERIFGKENQTHQCIKRDPGELFIDKSDELVLAFDRLVKIVCEWQPQYFSATKNAIVFTNHKAWMIVRPLKSALDIKIYLDEPTDSSHIHKINSYKSTHAHHLRIKEINDFNKEIVALLYKAHQNGMNEV